MVVKYKPSHKLLVFNLRAGLLRANKGFINIPEDIINQITILTDSENKFVYHSKWLTAAALTQTYKYIIKNSLKYSKLAIKKPMFFFSSRKISHIRFIIISLNLISKPKHKAKSISYCVAP
jgi:hypothetical protein